MDKYKNKYRIASTRLINWDYGSPGLYFITIKIKNNIHLFGEISNGKMTLNELGFIANFEWEQTIEKRPNMNLILGEFIVMPDHFHGIIGIGNNLRRDAMHCVSTNTNTNTTPNANKFGPQSNNLGAIIRGFKSSVTTYARKNNIEFLWQPRFHDHIIRNYNEFMRISNYIRNNPRNWNK